MNVGMPMMVAERGGSAAGWWVAAAQAQGVPDYQAAFSAIFGQGLWTIGVR